MIQQGLPFDKYLAINALNPSLIKVGVKSMKHLRYAMDHPTPSTDAMVLGNACHTAVFEPHELDNRFVVFDGRRDARTVIYQRVLLEAEESGKTVIRSAELQQAADMGLAVASDPVVKPLIASGKAEVTLMTEEEGIAVKGRLDWVMAGQGFCDLKTTRDIRSFAFCNSFFKYSYDISLGLYQRWLSRLRGQHEPCHVIAVESSPPFDVAVIPVPQAVLDEGVAKGLRVIRKYKDCMETDVWPGVAEGRDYELIVPRWAMGSEDLDWGDD